MRQGTPTGLASADQLGLSLAALIDQHGPAVYRLARSVVSDPGLSDDVTQETFIKVWKHLSTFRGDGSVRSWILRIAHREATAAVRRRRDRAVAPDQIDDTASAPPVAGQVEARLAMETFRGALEELDELSRAILVLREIEQLPYEEIAEVLDVPMPTVKSRLLRARRFVSTALEEWRD